ncbi:MAG: MFS transporter [Alphaproteobacteria bacterium]|nr:MFS transporter [Alphaproteobacteria bacterium]MDE2629545.1 MFS transporter [Alphaproteobacteria bacterium]
MKDDGRGGVSPTGTAGIFATPAPRIGWYRWIICAFLFFATTLNYVDRQTIAVLKPVLSREYGWTELDYANIILFFQTAYAIGYVLFGRLIDKLGARLGYSIAVVIWTCAHVACAFVSSLAGFSVMLFALGLGQSGNFPAALKAVAEWFPQRERALANGVFNAGSNIGAILTPLIVPIITLTFGWRMAFVATGSLSLIWLILWIAVYRRPAEHKRVSPAELAYIESDKPAPEKPVPWLKLIFVKETWAFALAKFMTDPIWWFYLFWLPPFFVKEYGLDIRTFGPPIIVIYILSDLGSIAGGWMSSTLIKRGASVNVARKLTMLLCAFAVMPVMFAQYAANMWLAVAIVGLATAAHQAFSANLYTLPSDLFPKAAVGSVSGIGGTAGAVGGMLMAFLTGLVLQYMGTYVPIFIAAGTMYLAALLVIHSITPRLAPAKLS